MCARRSCKPAYGKRELWRRRRWAAERKHVTNGRRNFDLLVQETRDATRLLDHSKHALAFDQFKDGFLNETAVTSPGKVTVYS